MLSRNEFSSSADDPPSWKTVRPLLLFDCSCTRLSNELSTNDSLSDCEDPPSANMACFFVAANRVFEARADFGVDAGPLRSGMDRYDDDTCDGEKPRTTLVVILRSDAVLTELAVVDCDDLSDDGGDTEDWALTGSGAVMIGLAMLLSFSSVVLASGARYEWVLMASGSRSFFSLMVMTIFSRSSGVICRSLPRLRLQPESCRWIRGLLMFSGAEVDALSSLSDSMASSSATESMLPESSGMSAG